MQVIYSFLASDQPNSGLISDANGVLYGTTEEGGGPGKGTVFSLTPPAGGQGAWTEATLSTFMAGKDGAFPAEDAGLTMDASGALYGTTINGGEGNGTAFRLESVSILRGHALGRGSGTGVGRRVGEPTARR